MGVGAVKRLSAINFGVVKDMMFTSVSYTHLDVYKRQVANKADIYEAYRGYKAFIERA